jgi:hypothetical protein
MRLSLQQYLDTSDFKPLKPLDYIPLQKGMYVFDGYSNSFKKIIEIDRAVHTISQAEQDDACRMVLDNKTNMWTKIPDSNYTVGKKINFNGVIFRNVISGSGGVIKKGCNISYGISAVFRHPTYLVDDSFLKKFLMPVNNYVSSILTFKKANASLISPPSNVSIP